MTHHTIVDLDDLKLAWQSLDRRLSEHEMRAHAVTQRPGTGAVRSGLRPLLWGQLVQVLCGVLLLPWGVSLWLPPQGPSAVRVVGAVVHLYGVLLVACGLRVVWLIRHVDYGAPVVAIQFELAELRRAYGLGGLTLGLSWWVLWMPFVMALVASVLGVDLYALAPVAVLAGLAIGALGLCLTVGLYQWAQRANHPRLAAWMREALTGRSLRQAEAALEGLRRFEQD